MNHSFTHLFGGYRVFFCISLELTGTNGTTDASISAAKMHLFNKVLRIVDDAPGFQLQDKQVSKMEIKVAEMELILMVKEGRSIISVLLRSKKRFFLQMFEIRLKI